MFIKFNDDSRTQIDVNEVSMFTLDKYKLEFKLRKEYATYEIEYACDDCAKKDFMNLSKILIKMGFIGIKDNLVLVKDIVSFSEDYDKDCITVLLKNGTIENIVFSERDDMVDSHAKLDKTINDLVEVKSI